LVNDLPNLPPDDGDRLIAADATAGIDVKLELNLAGSQRSLTLKRRKAEFMACRLVPVAMIEVGFGGACTHLSIGAGFTHR
jgi:hypothetical protein